MVLPSVFFHVWLCVFITAAFSSQCCILSTPFHDLVLIMMTEHLLTLFKHFSSLNWEAQLQGEIPSTGSVEQVRKHLDFPPG